MWAWVLPLVIVAVVLAWYIFTRGEPRSPLDQIGDVQIEQPEEILTTEPADVTVERPPEPAAVPEEEVPDTPPETPGT